MPSNFQELGAINIAWLGVEIMRHTEAVDWWLTAAGSVTLLAMNIIRIYQALRFPHSKSSKPKKRGDGKG